MPDITMCDNEECPKKEDCYRSIAKPNPFWQAWTTFNFTISEGEVFCSKFAPFNLKEKK